MAMRLKSLAGALLVTGLLAFSGGAAEAITLKMATDSGAKGSPAGDALETWAKLIEEGTNGEVQVEIFYQNELGGQQEVFDLFVAGDVDLMLNWPMTSYDKRIALLYAPYMVFSWEEALEAYAPGGWINALLDGIYGDIGLKFFGAWPEGFNGVATRGKYATTIEQAAGLKVRVPPAFPHAETVQALGYQTATIDWGEVFTAIQTGVVDGDAANVIYWDYEYFRDVLDYYVRTKHQFLTGILSMNLEEWDNLTPEQQQVIQDSAVKVMEQHFQAAQALDQHYVEAAKEAGMEYIEPTDEEIEALARAVREKIWPLMEQEIGADIMDQVRAKAAPL